MSLDFINKLKIVEEETDESMYFSEILNEINRNYNSEIKSSHTEANELLPIVVASIKTTRANQSKIVNRKS